MVFFFLYHINPLLVRTRLSQQVSNTQSMPRKDVDLHVHVEHMIPPLSGIQTSYKIAFNKAQ